MPLNTPKECLVHYTFLVSSISSYFLLFVPFPVCSKLFICQYLGLCLQFSFPSILIPLLTSCGFFILNIVYDWRFQHLFLWFTVSLSSYQNASATSYSASHSGKKIQAITLTKTEWTEFLRSSPLNQNKETKALAFVAFCLGGQQLKSPNDIRQTQNPLEQKSQLDKEIIGYFDLLAISTMPILLVPLRGITVAFLMFPPFTTTLYSLIVVNVVFVIKVTAWKPLLTCF